jgi:hypothetical protein
MVLKKYVLKGGFIMTDFLYIAELQGDIEDFIFSEIEWHESQR